MGGSSYPWSRLIAGQRVLISMDSQILRRNMLSSRAIALTLSILMGCSWSPTAVRGDFCFRWSFILVSRVNTASFLTLDFIDDTTLFVSCLWGGPGWRAGCWRTCGKPQLHDFWKFCPVFQMYLWYMVSPRWCRPGPLWCYERCQTCFWVGGSWRPTPCSHWLWVQTCTDLLCWRWWLQSKFKYWSVCVWIFGIL